MATLAELVATSTALSATRSRNAKSDLIANWLRSLDPGEQLIGASYIAGVVPQGRIGVGYAQITAAQAGPAATETSLDLLAVDRALADIAAESGAGSTNRRGEKLGALFAAAAAGERDFLAGLLAGSIRQGANEGVLIEAIARATEIPSEIVRHAAMITGDAAVVAIRALTGGAAGLAEFRIQLFRPLSPMLAQPKDSIDDVYAVLDGDLALDIKMDGARIQAHKDGDAVRVFSRHLRDITDSLPDVVRAVRALPAQRAILDGEAISMRPDGRPERFQTTMSRFARRGETPGGALSTFFFDCLLLDDDDLTARPARERFEALAMAVPGEGQIERLVPASRSEAEAFSRRARARGHEGVMAKALSSPYRAGSRGADWLKLKPVYTLDLVVLAAEWGSGRRRGWLSNLHLGARDPSGGFVMLGKTFKGMTDALLTWQTAELLARETSRDRHTVTVRPELVVEIAFGGVLSSPKYPGGLSLRFARVRRYRDDKRAAEADSIDAVRTIFENN